jgi:hypothetical protein
MIASPSNSQLVSTTVPSNSQSIPSVLVVVVVGKGAAVVVVVVGGTNLSICPTNAVNVDSALTLSQQPLSPE